MSTAAHQTVAPLKNVTAFVALVQKLQGRPYGVPGMGCFFGRSGHGKTTAAIFAQNALQVCHVEATFLGGTKELLFRIVRECGLRPMSSAARLAEQATEYLARTGRTLVIDEADFVMTERTMQVLRKLHDDSGAAVILCGEQNLPSKIGAFPQAHRRMLDWVQAEPATRDDVALLAAIHCPGIDLGRDLIDKLFEESRANQGYISVNLLNMHAHAAVRGLNRLTLAEFPADRFHTGQVPAPQRPVPGGRAGEGGVIPRVADLARGKRGAA